MVVYQRIAALGSSFAAGPSIEPLVDAGARRSGRNYPHLLAERLGATLTDLTVSGATTATILNQPQRTGLRKKYPPQILGVPHDADLITITAGGNDLGYSRGMIRAALANWLRTRWWTRPIGVLLARKPLPAATDSEVELATAGLVEVVRAAQARAPQARVVLVDYLTVLGVDPIPSLTAAQTAVLRQVADRLCAVFDAAAEKTGVDLVRASALSSEHALGSVDPWVTGFRPGKKRMPFHPTEKGMQAIAGEIYRVVSGTAASMTDRS